MHGTIWSVGLWGAVAGCGEAAAVETVDRFEGDRAVLVDDRGRVVERPRSQLPAGVRETDVLVEGAPDPRERALRLEALRDRRQRLSAADDGGPIVLSGGRR